MYTIRPLTDLGLLRQCEDLQRAVWGMGDREVVPFNQLVAAVAAGGLVLGAFDGPLLVGFSYAFPGLRNGAPLWYSHMTGVLRAYRGRGIGFQLKCAQRDAARRAGVSRIVWTYDPLQAVNACFNLSRLGATASRYYPDYYGQMMDELNRGLPSDRFEVDWALDSPRVAGRVAGESPPAVPPDIPWALAAEGSGPLAPPGEPALTLEAPVLRVEIPGAIGHLKAEAPREALRWREATRAVFLHYLARGYAATEALRDHGAGRPRVAYLLERTPHQGGTP